MFLLYFPSAALQLFSHASPASKPITSDFRLKVYDMTALAPADALLSKLVTARNMPGAVNRPHDHMVSFTGVAKRYPDGTQAVRCVDLHVPKGQFCVVLGPSGSGKSTLLRCVVGLTTQTTGDIHVSGHKVDRRSLTTIRRQVGMVHQSFNLSPRMDVLTNVLNGSLGSLPTWRALTRFHPLALRRRACDLLAQVGLEEGHLYRRAGELSGGQQQRVGIARACILRPTVLLADEPVASLDPSISRDIMILLRQASQRENATVLCSLHQVDLAREFADRIVGINRGAIVFDGSPNSLNEAALERIYARTTHPQVSVAAGAEQAESPPRRAVC